MKLNELPPVPGAQQERKRKGIGIGSGNGKTAGRGTKGQKARAGGNPRRGFEGGQMPLQRRLPKAGFHNVFKQCYTVVSVDRLNVFADGEEITPVLLVERGVIRRPRYPVKLLAGKEGLTHPVVVHVDRASSSAVAQVEAAGGRVVIREASVDGVDGSGSNE